jgi:ubiquinone/menaquinone biosynthesis C-methylase UbiE
MSESNIYAGVDYDSVPGKSTWGDEEMPLLQAIERLVSGGKWLNLAAGDGRFNSTLLDHCEEVVAADIDSKALAKLVRRAPSNVGKRLHTESFDLTKRFPYRSSSFAGCFCAAAIHTFHPDQVQFAVSEMIRVVRPHGRIILDFRADLKRLLPDGSWHVYPGEFVYSCEAGRTLLEKCFQGQSCEIIQFALGPTLTNIGTISYSFEAECLLLTCEVQK